MIFFYTVAIPRGTGLGLLYIEKISAGFFDSGGDGWVCGR